MQFNVVLKTLTHTTDHTCERTQMQQHNVVNNVKLISQELKCSENEWKPETNVYLEIFVVCPTNA